MQIYTHLSPHQSTSPSIASHRIAYRTITYKWDPLASTTNSSPLSYPASHSPLALPPSLIPSLYLLLSLSLASLPPTPAPPSAAPQSPTPAQNVDPESIRELVRHILLSPIFPPFFPFTSTRPLPSNLSTYLSKNQKRINPILPRPPPQPAALTLLPPPRPTTLDHPPRRATPSPRPTHRARTGTRTPV